MTNVVIYARYSSHGQTEQSIEGQLKVCYEFAERNNFHIVGEYIDRALTGTNDRRPEFQKMIEDSKKKLFQYVLVYQLDRFARDRYDSATYKHKLKKNGVRVLSAKENISADASGILMESVLEGMAEYYSVELAQKVKRGKDISAQKCKCVGGMRLFGFNVDKNLMYVINQDEATWVKRIYEMYANGTPVAHIMNYLNDNKVKNVLGKAWTINPIHRMLGNKKYNGIYVYRDIEIKGGLPKIIDDELFQKVITIKEKNKQAPSRGKAKVPYYLTTKLFCGECERSMVGVSGTSKTGEKYNYYKCLGRVKNEGCDLPPFRKDELEEIIISNVKSKLTDKLILELAKRTYDELSKEKGHETINTLQKRFEENKKAINKCVDLLIEGRNVDLLMDKIDALKLEQSEIEYKIQKEESMLFKLTAEQIASILFRIRDFEVTSEREKQMFFDSFVYRIFVYKDKKISVLLTVKDGYFPTYEHRCSYNSLMAEKKGFEPSHRVIDLLAFQASPFNHLGTSPIVYILYNILPFYSNILF